MRPALERSEIEFLPFRLALRRLGFQVSEIRIDLSTQDRYTVVLAFTRFDGTRLLKTMYLPVGQPTALRHTVAGTLSDLCQELLEAALDNAGTLPVPDLRIGAPIS